MRMSGGDEFLACRGDGAMKKPKASCTVKMADNVSESREGRR